MVMCNVQPGHPNDKHTHHDDRRHSASHQHSNPPYLPPGEGIRRGRPARPALLTAEDGHGSDGSQHHERPLKAVRSVEEAECGKRDEGAATGDDAETRRAVRPAQRPHQEPAERARKRQHGEDARNAHVDGSLEKPVVGVKCVDRKPAAVLRVQQTEDAWTGAKRQVVAGHLRAGLHHAPARCIRGAEKPERPRLD